MIEISKSTQQFAMTLQQEITNQLQPSQSIYYNAIHFNLEKAQHILNDALNSETYLQLINSIKNDGLELIEHNYYDAKRSSENDGKVHITIERDEHKMPHILIIEPVESFQIGCSLKDTEKTWFVFESID
jgi:hypothetical protein